MGMSKKNKQNISLILCTIGYIIAMILTILTNTIHTITINGTSYPLSSAAGILAAFMALQCILMVCNSGKRGLYTSYILLTLNIILMLQALIIRKNYATLPGLANTAITLLSTTIIAFQIGHREKHIITDYLTGFYNRRGLMQVLESKIESKEPFLLFYINLDDFKDINDNLGHRYGDHVISIVSKRIREILDKNYTVSRLDGDEFVVLTPANVNLDEITDDIMSAINTRITLQSYGQSADCYVTGSVGISRFPDDTSRADDLLKYADIAMHHAKNIGKNRYFAFNKEMRDSLQKQMQLEVVIKDSIHKNQIFFEYQPQFNLDTRQLTGFEALIRLQLEDGSILSPSEFIPVAEKTDLILNVDEYTFYHALMDFKELIAENPELLLTVNVSARNIYNRSYVDMINTATKESGIDPSNIILDVSERMLLPPVDVAVENLSQLRALGFKISLDDFGVGQSSLFMLASLPIDYLKIHKDFIQSIHISDIKTDFISTAITVGHHYNCKIIAEGVENEEQVRFLQDAGCDYIEGFILNKPLTIEEVKRVTKRRR
ncbi:MAG: bifunctional diguanylate cyclase/phosphodiesterase [Lachnospiraceae bacterium]|nr:bifunctional diguanylate cyclase/phosphodiesterase [Lachnospiraceae bacterium]